MVEGWWFCKTIQTGGLAPQTPFAGGHIVLICESSGSMGLDLR
jgi:hypothetical protein